MPTPQKQRGFWTFSTRLYAAPGVKQACLALQDRFGADVNLVLFCLWTVLDDTQWQAALRVSSEHQARIAPIRARRNAVPRTDPARPGLLAEELDAEKAEQKALEALVDHTPPDSETGQAQLRRYATALGVDADGFMEAAVLVLEAWGRM